MGAVDSEGADVALGIVWRNPIGWAAIVGTDCVPAVWGVICDPLTGLGAGMEGGKNGDTCKGALRARADPGSFGKNVGPNLAPAPRVGKEADLGIGANGLTMPSPMPPILILEESMPAIDEPARS